MDKLMLKKLTFSIALTLCITFAQAQESFWKKLVPDQANLQYAGSIGFISAGAGYDLFHEKMQYKFIMLARNKKIVFLSSAFFNVRVNPQTLSS